MKIIRERDIEAYLVKRVKAIGGEVRKVKWIGRKSAPDRLVMSPIHGAMWVELKALTLDLSRTISSSRKISAHHLRFKGLRGSSRLAR
jgi:hypothetical protein